MWPGVRGDKIHAYSLKFSGVIEGKKELEKAALLCLRMIETALEKQEQFANTLRSVTQQSAIMVSRLEDLLLSINPRTSAADYLLKIMR